MSIELFRQKWIEARYGKNPPHYLDIKEQNRLAKDYAEYKVSSERLSWRIVFMVLIIFIIIVHYVG